MAYDAAQGQVVLFGGLATVSSRLGDTWLWNGSNWTQASPANSPPARASGVMVYDAATSQIVLFGGVNAGGSDIGDTWLWNGTDWTQATPANSPSPRDDYAMVYDAAHGEVVLFGGASNGTYLNDTWVWNGTNWTQLSPANSPPARYTPGMAYDAALGQVVMWGGYNGTYLNDTWVWDGTNWTQETPQNSPTGRYASNAITYDAAQGQVLLFGGLDSSQEFNDTWVWGLPGNFGNVNVCPSGNSTPAPCSETLALTFNVPGTNFGATKVLTQGTASFDFSLASGNTCTGAVSPGTCTVNVTFTPLAPGLRTGAVELFNNSGALLTITPIYGVGQGPAVAFSPGTQTTVNTGSYSLSTPKGVTVDAAGNLFISNANGGPVVKVPAGGGTPTTLGVGLEFPQGMAVDGAGDLFIADNNLNEVLEVPAGCTSSICQQVVGTGAGLSSQLGVAIDGAGNLFVGDYNGQEVVEFPASGASPAAVYNPGGISHPVGLAVDGAGDLFIADYGLAKVVEVPAGCPSSGCQITVGSGWSQPESVAVNAAGDVFVADIGLGSPGAVVEVPAGCTSSSCQITVASGIQSYGATVDAAGDLFIADDANNRVVEVDRAQAPWLSFAATNVGSTSSDSPQSVTIQNIGNQTLGSVAPGLVVGPNFVQVPGPGTPADCSATFALTPGEECNLSISFDPQTGGNPLTSTAVFTDNALNAAAATQTIALSGVGVQTAPTMVAVPNVVGQAQAAATTAITGAQLALGTVTTTFSSTVPSGSVISQSPAAASQVAVGSAVNLVVSVGPQPTSSNPLTFENNYFVTGDYATGGVTPLLHGTGQNGIAAGTITISDSTTSTTAGQGVPDGADIIDAFLYWETLENTPSPSGGSGTFNSYPITGQQIGSDLPYTDGTFTGTLRVYRADVNTYFPDGANGVRFASGSFTVSLPDGGSALPVNEGASLVVIYRVLSPNFPLKSVVIYDGSSIPTTSTNQAVQGFYDAAGGTGEVTSLFAAGGVWNNSTSSASLSAHASQYTATLNPSSAYAAVIVSTSVTNSDNDGILDAWKAGPGAGDFHSGNPGYYDVKTGSWVSLPGAKHGEKDLFVQLDYMCGVVDSDGACDPSGENLFPSPDSSGNDPLAMVQQAFANNGVHLHLEVGNAIQEETCADNGPQLCEFPGQPGVISWKNSLEFAKLWPRNFTACASGGDCTARFPYGQKDSYHYVLFGHSLAIPAWNTRYGTLTSITVNNAGQMTIVTANRGAPGTINYCPSRFTISGVLGNPSLNGAYNTFSCPDAQTIILTTPGVPPWSYPNNTLPEPVIGLTSGTVTSISGYSDLGGSDSAVTLGLWLSDPNQDMSKRANVTAGTLFHEIGHTLGLSHGGLYYDGPSGSYIPTFEANCKPNYQSVMNYLFQLDLVGPNQAVAYSNQQLVTLNENAPVTQLTGPSNSPATFPTSAWYIFTPPSPSSSAATLHCDGTPTNGVNGYRVDASIAPITPAWTPGQDINFIGVLETEERGYNDWGNIDLRQVGATGGEFASLASVLSFGTTSPQNIVANGNATLGSGGTITLGNGGNVTLSSGGNVTLGSGGTITLGSGGNITLGSGGTITLGSGGTVTPGSSGTVTLGSGGTVTIVGSATITDAGNTTQVPSSGGIYAIGSGGTIALGSGGNVTLGSGGNVTLGSGGTIALGSGGNVTLGSGGNVTLGSGGTITLGSGGNVTLGSGGNVTLGSGGTVTLGSLSGGSGGNVTLGSGGTVTLGSGGTVTLGSGGNVTLGSGGNVTLGSGGTITLGSGGNVTLGSGGNVTLGSGGTITLGSGGNVTLGSGGNVTLGSGGTITEGGNTIQVPTSGGTYTIASGGTITLGSGGNITLGSGGNVTLGSGGTIALGSGGTIALGSGGNVTLGSGGTITLGSGGNVTLGSGGTVTLGSGGNVTLGSGGLVALGSGGNVTLGSGGTIALGSGGTIALGSGGTIALGSGGNVTLGSGGATTTELNYLTADSIVRPPSSPTETPTPAGVVVNWTAPAFGVVQAYTIYRSVNGGTPSAIGNVTGDPPPTTFTDTNPDTTPGDVVVYTITTTLAQVAIDPTTSSSRQSVPSPPAVLKNNQTITLGSLPTSVLVSGPQPAVTATSMSNGNPDGLQVNFSATGSCSIANQSINMTTGVSSATVALNSTGSCTIVAAQLGATSFNAATSVSGTFPILPQSAAQTIMFATNPPSTAAYNSTFTVAAAGGASGNPVTFTSSGACTVSIATYTMTSSTGICSVIANQAGNSNYVAAPQVILSVNAILAAQTITFTAPQSPVTYGVSLIALSATGGASGNSVVFTIDGSSTGTGTISGSALTVTGVGTLVIDANQLGNLNYAAATQMQRTIVVNKAAQTITFVAPQSPVTYGVSPIALSATGGASGSLVVFTIDGSSTGTGTIAGNVLTVTGAGALVIDANQKGNSNYGAATQVQRTIVVNQAAATISITNLPASPVYGGNFTPAYLYTGNGGPTESVASSTTGVCTVSGSVVSFVGVGACTLTASATATTDYSAATGSLQSFTVGKAAQTITFGQPTSPVIYGITPIALSATASSGLPVTFSVDPTSTGTGTISGKTLTVTGPGNLVIDANQAGNTDYLAATLVQRTIVVNKAVLTVTANNASRAYGLANPTFTAAYNGYVNGDSFATAVTGSPSLTTAAVVTSLPGSYPIFASQGTLASAKYTFSFVSGTLTVAFTGSVPASSSACNGAYSGTFQGSLSVAGTQNCVFVGGGATGNITETGGNVVLGSATVGGNLIVTGGTFSIGPSATIKGNLTVQSIPTGTAQNQICGTSVGGSLVLQSVGTAVVIGSGSSSCPGDTISGSLTLQANKAAIGLTGNTVDGSLTDQSNTASTTLSGNTVNGSLTDQGNAGASVVTLNLVTGNLIDQSNSASSILSLNTIGANLTDQGNTAPTQVTGNKVTGTLLCQSNSSITGSGNTASKKQGQCANF
jgi:hypothetical protein